MITLHHWVDELNDKISGQSGRAATEAQWPCVHNQGDPSSLRKSAVVKLGDGWALPSLHALGTPNDEDNNYITTTSLCNGILH